VTDLSMNWLGVADMFEILAETRDKLTHKAPRGEQSPRFSAARLRCESEILDRSRRRDHGRNPAPRGSYHDPLHQAWAV
jgi:hypothetical protein